MTAGKEFCQEQFFCPRWRTRELYQRIYQYQIAVCSCKIPEEKGKPRCLRKFYLATREGSERDVALLVEQAQKRMLEQELLTIERSEEE